MTTTAPVSTTTTSATPWQKTVDQELAEDRSGTGHMGLVLPNSKMDSNANRRREKGERQYYHQHHHQQYHHHHQQHHRKDKEGDAASMGHQGYQRSQNVLRIERRTVTVEYLYDESRWTRDEWLNKSGHFQAPKPDVKKWFLDSADSDVGSWAGQQDVTAKICICGDAAVGKTSFTQRYVNREFQKTYKWTVGVDFALKVVKWSDNISIKLQLWDIAGQERFTSMTRVYYKDAHACIIMFDLTQRSTFKNALKWKKDLDSKCTLSDGSPVPCILLANKCDLARREVEQTEIEDFCKEQNFIGWTEISVLQGQMIEESMNFLLEEMMKKRGEWDDSLRNDEMGDSTNIKLRRASTQQRDEKKCGC